MDQPSVNGIGGGCVVGTISGTVAPDGTYVGDLIIDGESDARNLLDYYDEMGLESDEPDDICNLMLGFGITCEPCNSDGEPYCIRYLIEDMVANETGQSMDLVCEDQCHEMCDDNDCTTPQLTTDTCVP